MVKGVTKVIELHEFSDSLDDLLMHKMIESGINEEMTMEEYQKIYKALDNYDQRIYQINLGAEVTRIFYKLSRKWIVGISLKTVKKTFYSKGKPLEVSEEDLKPAFELYPDYLKKRGLEHLIRNNHIKSSCIINDFIAYYH